MAGTTSAENPAGTARSGRPDAATEVFVSHRDLLFTVAYQMLGSAADVEDVLQETWLRWVGVDSDSVREVLETLAPIERAVFVLREVFDLGYEEIAEAVDRTPSAVRQLAYRARAHIAARRPRGVVSAADTRRALDAFQPSYVNGHPALILRLDGRIDTVFAVRVDDGLITGLYSVRNPEKLSRVQRQTTLHR